jgi:hypothetical protein
MTQKLRDLPPRRPKIRILGKADFRKLKTEDLRVQDVGKIWQRCGKELYGSKFLVIMRPSMPSYGAFEKLRTFCLKNDIPVSIYIESLFAHAAWHRRFYTGAARKTKFVKNLWRPYPNAATSEYYQSIYAKYKEQTQPYTERPLEPRGRTVVASMRDSAETVVGFPKKYPHAPIALVYRIFFEQLDPTFLYFFRPVRELIDRGAGTEAQKKTFEALDADPAKVALFGDLAQKVGTVVKLSQELIGR